MIRRNVDTIDYLAGAGVVFRFARKYYEIKQSDIDLMFYLYPLKFFTTKQFQDGEMLYSWDKHRFLRLVRDDWFKKVYEGNRRMGEHDKYALTKKANLMIKRLDRILHREELIPESPNRNPIFKRDSYSDKVLANAIIKYNKETRKKL